ncbi:MAG: tRNA (cytidine(34)-2'-O)-methyltransferase [Gloeomargarita sp. GMQP_bins_120]
MLIEGMYSFCDTDFPLHVVLVQPQIPPNTGNIARTCAATRTPLHLIGPLGFELSDRYLKRAGLDYWPYVRYRVYPDWPSFVSTCTPVNGRWLAFTPQAETCFWDYRFRWGDWLFFGSETTGLPQICLQACHAHLHIPMVEPGVRSLNLSVSVAVALFEARRQLYHEK